MFASLKRLSAAADRVPSLLEELRDAVHGLNTHGSHSDEIERRLAALERDVERRYAEAEALQIKAESRFAAARSSEERARRYAQSGGDDGDEEGDLDAEAFRAALEEAGVSGYDAGGGEDQGLHALSSRVGRRRLSKLNAHSLKRGR